MKLPVSFIDVLAPDRFLAKRENQVWVATEKQSTTTVRSWKSTSTLHSRLVQYCPHFHPLIEPLWFGPLVEDREPRAMPVIQPVSVLERVVYNIDTTDERKPPYRDPLRARENRLRCDRFRCVRGRIDELQRHRLRHKRVCEDRLLQLNARNDRLQSARARHARDREIRLRHLRFSNQAGKSVTSEGPCSPRAHSRAVKHMYHTSKNAGAYYSKTKSEHIPQPVSLWKAFLVSKSPLSRVIQRAGGWLLLKFCNHKIYLESADTPLSADDRERGVRYDFLTDAARCLAGCPDL